jgi:hypothetical protein
LINTSFPIDFGSDDNITFNDFGIKSEEELIRSTYNTKNMGLGVDLGFMKDWDSELTLYGSVVDLGFINWKSNVNNFQAKIVDSLSFKGVEINNPEKISFEGDDILDSIINMVKFSHTQKAYSTSLATKIYFGGNYKFTKTFAIGLLGKLQKYPYNYEFSSTASANFKPGKWGTATISYSYYKRNFTNIGLGYALKLGIFQWYAVYDNLIGALLFPHNTRYISARWGVNVLVGNPNKKKPAKNMPLLWTL